ncbi:hypothetical protein KIPE111705_07150 [Kibdelosporangium persicum]
MVNDGDQPRPDTKHVTCMPLSVRSASIGNPRHCQVRLLRAQFAVAVVVTALAAVVYTAVALKRRAAPEVDTTRNHTVISVGKVVDSVETLRGQSLLTGKTVVRIASGRTR